MLGRSRSGTTGGGLCISVNLKELATDLNSVSLLGEVFLDDARVL